MGVYTSLYSLLMICMNAWQSMTLGPGTITRILASSSDFVKDFALPMCFRLFPLLIVFLPSGVYNF
ncbi:hypothetical protein GGR51DRAFT_530830 [Nemania sp. FL0031]|nr:hypothetical protein GGR51DRAFT_530830 [Nemania sp. FL0031]